MCMAKAQGKGTCASNMQCLVWQNAECKGRLYYVHIYRRTMSDTKDYTTV